MSMMTKNPAAVALGQLGGRARRRKMTASQRSEAASQAARGRWEGKPALVCPVCGDQARSVRALQKHRSTAHFRQRAAKPLKIKAK